MLIPLALVVFLLVTTAIIAPWSDNLGKKLGKKRVSVFGLRPRTSATVLTIASSWVIMFFTLGALLLTVAPLRHALFRYQIERDEARVVETRLRIAKRDALILKRDVQRAQDDLTAAKSQAANFEDQATIYKGQATTFQQNAQKFKTQAQSAQGNFAIAKRGEAIARRGAQTATFAAQQAKSSAQKARIAADSAHLQEQVARAALGNARQNLDAAQTQLQTIQSRLAQSQTRLTQSQTRLTQSKARLIQTRAQLTSAHAQLTSAYKDLAASYTKVARADANVARAEKKVNDLQKQANSLTRRIRVIGSFAIDSAQLAQELAFGGIVLPVDQTLAERRFDATREPEQIARQLRILIGAAQHATSDGKVGIVPGSKFLVGAAIADPQTNKPIDLDEDQAVQLYANALSSANQTVSARLVSAFNYPSTTTVVTARFVFVPIHTIYIARENIAEATINTGKSESAIFRQLQDLVDAARRNADKRGARPPLSPDEQNFFDGDTGPKIFDALREVQKFDHPVSVRIVAARDLDSAEPLQVRFIVGDQTA